MSALDSYRDPWIKRSSRENSERKRSTSAGALAATNKSAATNRSTPDLKASQRTPLELVSGEPEFADEKPLLKELRAIFDWMAQEAGATRIPSREFKQRLPMLHRRMPFMASSFKRMDANGDCWLEWDEFVNFCLSDVRLIQQMRRTSTISVYGRQRKGPVMYKEQLNPQLMCEMGTPPPLLPWEAAHVVEWRVEGLVIGPRKGSPVYNGNQIVRPGTCVASPPFRGAGCCGFLRLWPSGYWTEAQRRSKVDVPHATADTLVIGPYPMPPSNAWCCLGACMPAGTHLVLRFFVGDMKSEKRECYWHSGTHPGTLWSPPQQEPPILKEGDSITVGIEIFRNLGGVVEKKPAPHKEKVMKGMTPGIKEPFESWKRPGIDRSTSLPALPSGSSWRKLDTLLQAHRCDEKMRRSRSEAKFSQTF
mmetsp:Transcript_32317/g.57191  ORF Transcript_32317/g.57191 Transcript_32317/m.57191 type:complete len:420 (+) Transcript_32317:125-1384(+)